MRETKRVTLLLVLLVVLPLTVIGGLGVQVMQSDYATFQVQQTKVAARDLQQVSDHFKKLLDDLILSVRERTRDAGDSGDTSQIRNIAFADVQIDVLAIYDAERQRLFPPQETSAILVPERDFLRKATPAFMRILDRMPPSATQHYWGGSDYNGLMPVCWWDEVVGHYCALLNRDAVTEYLLRSLDQWQNRPNELLIRLLDSNGEQVWPQNPQAQVWDSISLLPLPMPLQPWHLEAALPADARIESGPWITLAAIILPMLTILGGMAFYLYQMHQARIVDGRRRIEVANQISHELRTPLANLRLYADLIQGQANENSSIAGYGRIIDAEAERLGALVDNAIICTKQEGQEQRSLETAYPAEVVRRMISRYRPLLDAADTRVTLSLETNALMHFDREALERILVNLLDNARKHAPGSPVTLSLTLNGQFLYLTVRDYGPGVAEQWHERIFEPLARVGQADGFGIGLAACRRLARINHGDMRLERVPSGASFQVWLKVDVIKEAVCVS